jgi:hypothetical protein
LRAAAREKNRAAKCASEQLLDQGLQFGKARGYRKQLLLFGGKMKGDLLFEDLLNFRLPCLEVDSAGLNGAIQAHAQRQAMLVLVGERNQVLVTKHVYLFSAWPGRSATKAAPRLVTPVTLKEPVSLMRGTGRWIQALAVTAWAASLAASRRVSQSVRTLSHSWIKIP